MHALGGFRRYRLCMSIPIMRGSWIRKLTGRSLLRERRHRRALPLGECPRCGQLLEVSTDCWLDAERVMLEHESICEVSTIVDVIPSAPRSPRPVLRSA